MVTLPYYKVVLLWLHYHIRQCFYGHLKNRVLVNVVSSPTLIQQLYCLLTVLVTCMVHILSLYFIMIEQIRFLFPAMIYKLTKLFGRLQNVNSNNLIEQKLISELVLSFFIITISFLLEHVLESIQSGKTSFTTVTFTYKDITCYQLVTYLSQ